MNEHQKDFLKQSYAEIRGLERNSDPSAASRIIEPVMEKFFSAMDKSYRDRFAGDTAGLIAAGYMEHVPGGAGVYRITDTGYAEGKRLFDEMLAEDGYTEEQYFSDNLPH